MKRLFLILRSNEILRFSKRQYYSIYFRKSLKYLLKKREKLLICCLLINEIHMDLFISSILFLRRCYKSSFLFLFFFLYQYYSYIFTYFLFSQQKNRFLTPKVFQFVQTTNLFAMRFQ